MILTEDEARKHYCDIKLNREQDKPFWSSSLFCEASQCMQWVEYDRVKKTGYCGRNIAHAMQRNRPI